MNTPLRPLIALVPPAVMLALAPAITAGAQTVGAGSSWCVRNA